MSHCIFKRTFRRAALMCVLALVAGCGDSEPVMLQLEDADLSSAEDTHIDGTTTDPDSPIPLPQDGGERDTDSGTVEDVHNEENAPDVDVSLDEDGMDSDVDPDATADDALDGDPPDPLAGVVSLVDPACVGCGRASTTRYSITHHIAPIGPTVATSPRYRLEATRPYNGTSP
jgi:hypothetical protein